MSRPELELLYILTAVVVAQNHMRECGKERVGRTENSTDIYTTTCKTARGKLLYNTGISAPCSARTLEGLDGGVGGKAQKGGDICILMGDSHWCTAETNTTLLSNYTPIKREI